MVNAPVLVLNQNCEPLNICRARRAIVMLWRGKAEVIELNSATIHSSSLAMEVPSVIRLVYLIKRPRIQRKLNRRDVFARDKYTCQYCGKSTKDLTIDHVIPRRLGGEHIWDNVVSACKACNQRKAGRSPKDAGMKLRNRPCQPKFHSCYPSYEGFYKHPEWQKYVLIDN